MKAMARFFNGYANASAIESIAIKAAHLLPHLVLQKSSAKLKAKTIPLLPTLTVAFFFGSMVSLLNFLMKKKTSNVVCLLITGLLWILDCLVHLLLT